MTAVESLYDMVGLSLLFFFTLDFSMFKFYMTMCLNTAHTSDCLGPCYIRDESF